MNFDVLFFFSSRRRHTRSYGDWSSDVCSSDLKTPRSSSYETRLIRRKHERLVSGLSSMIAKGGRRSETRWARFLPKGVNFRSEERRVGKECRSRRWQ